AGEPAEASLQTLKTGGMSPELSAELHNGMLLEGVHLFHGSGFLSAAHSERDVEQTVAAFAATLARLPAGLLPGLISPSSEAASSIRGRGSTAGSALPSPTAGSPRSVRRPRRPRRSTPAVWSSCLVW